MTAEAGRAAPGRPGAAASLGLGVLRVTAAVALLLRVLVALGLVVLRVIIALPGATVLAPPAEWLRAGEAPA